jgi:hypothetical protein
MTEQTPRCLVCGRTNTEIPLLTLTYQDENFYICPQDLPTLIHKPANLVGKLPGAENLKAHDHD